MGRHKTKGIEYFNIDCVQQDNLNYVEAKHGIIGYGVFVKLLRKIYMIEGYYCDFTEKNLFLFSKEIGVSSDEVKAVLKTCLEEGIFSDVLYGRYQILTSAGIQKRWLRIVTDAKRKDKEIESKFHLLAKTPEETVKTPEVIQETPGVSTQSKVKDSKVEERKVLSEGTGKPDAPPEKRGRVKKTREGFVAPSQSEIENHLLATVGDSRKPAAWPADRCRNVATEIYLNYTANGWVQSKGKPIVDWKAAVSKWALNEIKGTYSHAHIPSMAPATIPPRPVINTVPSLTKQEEELNYLYGRFIENQVTIISIESAHYNYLKNNCHIEFSEEQTKNIETRALEHMKDKAIAVNDISKLRFMKCFGVLEYFKELQVNGKETIFKPIAKIS